MTARRRAISIPPSSSHPTRSAPNSRRSVSRCTRASCARSRHEAGGTHAPRVPPPQPTRPAARPPDTRASAQLACGKYLAALAHTGDDAMAHTHARSATCHASAGDGSAGSAGSAGSGADFRRLYMEILTEGAADELDALRADGSLDARGLGALIGQMAQMPPMLL